MIEDGQTDAQIVAALFRRGVQTSERSLHRRLQFWGLRRQQNVVNDEMVAFGKGNKYLIQDAISIQDYPKQLGLDRATIGHCQ